MAAPAHPRRAVALPGLVLVLAFFLLQLLITPSSAFTPLAAPAARHHHRTPTRLAATTTTVAGSRAAISIDPKTLPVPALKQKILQLAAAMDRGKLQVRSIVWGCGCGCGCKCIYMGNWCVGTDGAEPSVVSIDRRNSL